MSQLLSRPAVASDRDFVATCIIEAEASGTEQTTYERVFGISREEIFDFVCQLLDEDLECFEMSLPVFWVIENDGKPVAGCAGWVECEYGGPSSATLRAQALAYVLGREKWQASLADLQRVAAISMPRKADFLQLEAFFVLPEFRGRWLTGRLVREQEERFRKQFPELKASQMLVWGNNETACRLYERQGYKIVDSTESKAGSAGEKAPAAFMFSMEKHFYYPIYLHLPTKKN